MGFDKCICLISIEVIVVSLNTSSVLGVIVRSLYIQVIMVSLESSLYFWLRVVSFGSLSVH